MCIVVCGRLVLFKISIRRQWATAKEFIYLYISWYQPLEGVTKTKKLNAFVADIKSVEQVFEASRTALPITRGGWEWRILTCDSRGQKKLQSLNLEHSGRSQPKVPGSEIWTKGSCHGLEVREWQASAAESCREFPINLPTRVSPKKPYISESQHASLLEGITWRNEQETYVCV